MIFGMVAIYYTSKTCKSFKCLLAIFHLRLVLNCYHIRFFIILLNFDQNKLLVSVSGFMKLILKANKIGE